MNEQARRAIAYIVGRVASGRQASAVYSYDAGRYSNFSGDVADQSVSVYDYDESCYVTGSLDSLYHYGNSAYITIDRRGDSFSGYDYASGSHFTADVRGTSVSVYDYGTGSHYDYTL